MTYAIIIASFAILVILLNFYGGSGESKEDENSSRSYLKGKKSKSVQKSNIQCPVCTTFLNQGEDLISRVYRPMNVPDQLCTINGCPHCYPVPEAGIKRICPVCHKNIPVKDGHLIARLFNKTEGKKHVVVTGCTECCKGRA